MNNIPKPGGPDPIPFIRGPIRGPKNGKWRGLCGTLDYKWPTGK